MTAVPCPGCGAPAQQSDDGTIVCPDGYVMDPATVAEVNWVDAVMAEFRRTGDRAVLVDALRHPPSHLSHPETP